MEIVTVSIFTVAYIHRVRHVRVLHHDADLRHLHGLADDLAHYRAADLKGDSAVPVQRRVAVKALNCGPDVAP